MASDGQAWDRDGPPSAALVRQLAALARIELAPDELPRLQQDLARILAYVRVLQRTADAGAPLSLDADPPERLRADRPHSGLASEEALRAAPARQGPYFTVPAVLPRGPKAAADV